MASLREYASARELLVNLTLRELRSKYKKSVLGWTWSLLNPLSSVLIYTIVFSGFLDVQAPIGDPSGLDSFVFFLLCGLIPWNFIAGSISLSLETLVANGNLIKKVYFPRELLVASTIASLLVTFAHRARRGLRDPAHRRQHGAALDPGRAGADGAARRAWCSAWA